MHDAERPDDAFAELRLAALRNDPPDLGLLRQPFGRCHETADDEVGVERRVQRDVVTNRGRKRNAATIRCGSRAAAPLDFLVRHRSPASNCASPSSILARNTSCSIASSMVASTGRSFNASRILSFGAALVPSAIAAGWRAIIGSSAPALRHRMRSEPSRGTSFPRRRAGTTTRRVRSYRLRVATS